MLSWVFWIPFVIKRQYKIEQNVHATGHPFTLGTRWNPWALSVMVWWWWLRWGRPVLLVWTPLTWSPQPLSSVTLPWQCEFYLWIQSREWVSKYKYTFPSVKIRARKGFLQGVEGGTAYKEAKSVKRKKSSYFDGSKTCEQTKNWSVVQY